MRLLLVSTLYTRNYVVSSFPLRHLRAWRRISGLLPFYGHVLFFTVGKVEKMCSVSHNMRAVAHPILFWAAFFREIGLIVIDSASGAQFLRHFHLANGNLSVFCYAGPFYGDRRWD